MKKVKLLPFEIQMASDVANRRFIENIKMNRTFGAGYKGSNEKTLALGIMGCCGEIAYCKGQNVFFNGSYSDEHKQYKDTDIAGGIEIRTQQRKTTNKLIIRPNDKKAKYVLVIDEGNWEYTIQGFYPYIIDIDSKYLTNFGISSRPYCYGIPLQDLYPIEDI
tara:strand:- start:439 stop:927 length:489 start_codon:yes stop_codon:yes gene_type:complete